MIKDIRPYFLHNSWRETFFNATLYFYVGTLPLFLNLNTIALWCLALSSILTIKSHNGLANIKNNISNIIPICMVFFLFVFGLGLSKDTHRVWADIGRAVPLFLIPVILFLHSKKNFNIKRIYIALGIGLGIGMLICWYNILISILSKTNPIEQASYFFEWIYTDINLVRPLDGHPSYFAILLVIFISALIFDEHFKSFRKNKFVFFLLLFPFAVFLIETSSRIGVVVLVTVIIFYGIKNFNFKSLASIALLVFIVATVSLKFDYLGLKFQKIINSKGEINDERAGRWKEILYVYKDKDAFLLGVGSGDARLVYRRAYYNGRYDLALKKNYNAHNQYLEFLVANGVLGLTIYFTLFFVFIKQTRLKGTALHIFIAFVLFSFTETIFGRSQGVMIFSFFYTFSIIYYKPQHHIKNGNK